ncbi:hypothetical protein [Rothia nasimurium]|uniref:hypothetical protein n=1 Tax=Rothia nasimurium TaxID=85336 RepID=UPI0016233632|nr:hypothetical protein [Rothia nasimurium]
MTQEKTPAPEPEQSSTNGIIIAALIGFLACVFLELSIIFWGTDQQLTPISIFLPYGAAIFLGIALLVPLFRKSESKIISSILAILYIILAFAIASFVAAIAGWSIYSNGMHR